MAKAPIQQRKTNAYERIVATTSVIFRHSLKLLNFGLSNFLKFNSLKIMLDAP